jgi:hypothetical protein
MIFNVNFFINLFEIKYKNKPKCICFMKMYSVILARETETIIQIVLNENEKVISFESSYRNIYDLCTFGDFYLSTFPSLYRFSRPPKHGTCACGYCILFRILEKHQKSFTIKSTGHLIDIFSYGLRRNTHTQHSAEINELFANNIIRFYNITIKEILKKYHVPYDICSIITSHIYDKTKSTYQDIRDNITFLERITKLININQH